MNLYGWFCCGSSGDTPDSCRLAPFHLSITIMPIQSLLAPQAEQSMILETEKGRGISPTMNSGLSPPAA